MSKWTWGDTRTCLFMLFWMVVAFWGLFATLFTVVVMFHSHGHVPGLISVSGIVCLLATARVCLMDWEGPAGRTGRDIYG